MVHVSQDKDLLQLVGTGVHVRMNTTSTYDDGFIFILCSFKQFFPVGLYIYTFFKVMVPKGREMMGAEQVVNKFGVSPELFRDYQAIMGDTSVRDTIVVDSK